MIVILGTFRLPPENLAAARPHIAALVAASNAEEGCLLYAYAEDLQEPGLIRVSETWTDQPRLTAHAAADHIKTWRAASASLGLHDRNFVAYDAGQPRPL